MAHSLAMIADAVSSILGTAARIACISDLQLSDTLPQACEAHTEERMQQAEEWGDNMDDVYAELAAVSAELVRLGFPL